jgi:hypothetical protein
MDFLSKEYWEYRDKDHVPNLIQDNVIRRSTFDKYRGILERMNMIYPTDLPVQALNNFLQLALNRGHGANVKRIVADAYISLGYVLGQSVGEPQPMMTAMADPIMHMTQMQEQLKGMNKDWTIVLGGILATLSAWYASKLKPVAP